MIATLDTTKQLGEAVITEVETGLEQSRQRVQGRPGEIMQREAMDDQRIVVRPDATAVITERIENAFRAGERPPTPAGVQVWLHQPIHDCARFIRFQYTREQKMPGVG